MNVRWNSSCLLLLLLALTPAGCSRAPDDGGPRVVVVCVEALRHDYPSRVSMPNLDRLAREGAVATRLVPVFPTNSVPNKAAIATGTAPAKSGIINNIFFDRRFGVKFEAEPEDLARFRVVEPLWVTASRLGVPAGAINWEAADAAFRGESASRTSQLTEDDSDEDRVDELVRWILDRRADAPRLILTYLDEFDDISHEFGPNAAETLRAVDTIDEQIGRIVAAIEASGRADRTTLLLLGDHGMAEANQCIYLQAYLRRLGFDAMTLSSGATSNVYLDAGTDAAEVKAALEKLGERYTVYLPTEASDRFAYEWPDRVGDLVMVGERGSYFRDRGGRNKPVDRARLPGVHGFSPEDPDMMATLVAWGRGVPSGHRWPERSILDVHPTVSLLLGIAPPHVVDGSALPGVGVQDGGLAGR